MRHWTFKTCNELRPEPARSFKVWPGTYSHNQPTAEDMMRLNIGQHIVLLLGIAIFAIMVWIAPVIRLQLLAVAFATGAAVYLLGKAS